MAAHPAEVDTSDLAGLWDEAVADFKGSTKLDLTEWHFTSMDDAMASAKQQSEKFSTWRHDKGKVDYVRSLLGNNLANIQRAVSGAQTAANAAGAFPPALPATMLMTAFTVVFQTFKDLKADYDRVCGFYTQMASFFDQISMVENRSPKLAPFERCIRKVFSAMLIIAGIAADYKSKGRFKKWAKNLVDGAADPKLAGAYSTMDDAIVKLHQAVGLATLSVLVEVQETTTRIEGKTENIIVSQQEIKDITLDTHHDVSSLREGQEEALLQFGAIKRVMSSGFDGVARIEAQNQQLRADFKDMMNMALRQSASEKQGDTKHEKLGKGASATGSRRYKNAQVKGYFSDGAEARNIVRMQSREIAETFVEGTTEWIFEDDTYKSWAEGEIPALWLVGGPGTGKSFIAHAVASKLDRQREEHISVASFLFREDQDALGSLRNALRCAVLQIADSNQTYLDAVAADIATENADEDPWSQFFTSRFPADSQAHLYLILDGVDEARSTDQKAIAALIRQLPSAKLNIHILFTGRPSLTALFEENAPKVIHMTKGCIAHDMQLLITSRIRSSPVLRKFNRQTKRRIAQRLGERADSMLYIEHMLRRLSVIGREGAVLKDLEKNMPDSLESLYRLLLAECQRGRTHAQYLSLKALFAMLAYSERPLSLDEAIELVKLTDPDDTLDLEEELIGRSARLLDVDGDQEDDTDGSHLEDGYSDDSDSGAGDHNFELVDVRGKTRIALQERSMREYFRAVNVEDDGLRTSTAHSHLLIFELLVRLLCDDAPDTVVDKPCLHSYAARYWAHHFVKIDVAAEHVASVLGGLSTILNNVNNVAASFESYKAPYYDTLQEQTSFLDKLEAFLEIAKGVEDLPAMLKDWIRKVSDTPKKAILPLARGHVSNQFDPLSRRFVDNTYLYAQSALVTAGVFIVEGDDKLDIVKVLEYFPDVDSKSVDALRAIAHVLQLRAQYESSEEFARKALSLPDPSPETRFRTHWVQGFNVYNVGWQMNKGRASAEEGGHAVAAEDASLQSQPEYRNKSAQPSEKSAEVANAEGAESDTADETSPQGLQLHGNVPQAKTDAEVVVEGEPRAISNEAKLSLPGDIKLEEALQHVVSAMTLLPAGWQLDDKWVTAVAGIFILKGDIHRCLQSTEGLLAAYNESRAIRPAGNTLNPIMLTSMINVEQFDINKQWWAQDAVNPSRYFDIIESLTPFERLKWFTYVMEIDNDDGEMAGWALRKCAKREGERGLKIAAALYEAYLKTLGRTTSKWAQAKNDFASFYQIAANDLRKACDLGIEILGMEYSEDDEETLEYTLYETRHNLCDNLFELFRQSGDPLEKQELLDTMTKLPMVKIEGGGDEAAKRSEEELDEAPVLVMQALMTRTIGSPVEFRQRMEHLFHLSVAGLTDKLGNNDSRSFRLLAKVLACVPGLTRDAEIALSCQYSITDPSVEHPDEEDEEESDDGEDGKEEQVKNSTGDLAASGHDPQSNDVTVEATVKTHTVETTESQLAELTMDLARQVQNLTVNGKIEPKEGEIAQDTEEDDTKEDLLPEYERYQSCSGTCRLSASSWADGTMYMCIHCEDCDLCEGCYEKRMAWNRGEPNTTFWYDWCGKDHAYVKGPIEGWRGVKNGVIRIGTEEVDFKEWLQTLQNERWPKAWESFWKGEIFLRA